MTNTLPFPPPTPQQLRLKANKWGQFGINKMDAHALADQIDALNTALRFYAEEDNWEGQECPDRGTIARSTLERFRL